MTTTDPAAIPEDVLPTCQDCFATYGPPGRRYDPVVFGVWLKAHEAHMTAGEEAP